MFSFRIISKYFALRAFYEASKRTPADHLLDQKSKCQSHEKLYEITYESLDLSIRGIIYA